MQLQNCPPPTHNHKLNYNTNVVNFGYLLVAVMRRNLGIPAEKTLQLVILLKWRVRVLLLCRTKCSTGPCQPGTIFITGLSMFFATSGFRP